MPPKKTTSIGARKSPRSSLSVTDRSKTSACKKSEGRLLGSSSKAVKKSPVPTTPKSAKKKACTGKAEAADQLQGRKFTATKSIDEETLQFHLYGIKEPHIVDAINDEFNRGDQSASFTAMAARLKECMLRQRWGEANGLLKKMCLYKNPDTHYHWKCGVDVLRNHPNGNAELVESLFSVVCKADVEDQNKKKLELVFYLLSVNKIEEAYQTIKRSIPYTPGRRSSHQTQVENIWREMTVAYTGLIEYCIWSMEGMKDKGTGSTMASRHADSALMNLASVMHKPGVWDVFVTRQVEILERRDSIKEVEAVLTNYRDSCPENPNSHVYLCEFLKKYHPTNTDGLRQVLKTIAQLLPAERYTMEYIELLEEEKVSDVSEVIPMLFNMLDYGSCTVAASGWKLLRKHVEHIVYRKQQHDMAVLTECWNHRRFWWPNFHFDQYRVSKLMKQGHGMARDKAVLAAIFLGSDCSFVQRVRACLWKEGSKSAGKLDEVIIHWTSPLFKLALHESKPGITSQ